MHVAICIVGFRNAGEVARCLEALSLSTHRDFEVVVCENGGSAAFRALQAQVPQRLSGGQLVTLENAAANFGYGGGVNRCIARTSLAEAWWILNPDTAPEPQALAALVARLARGDCEAVGGVLRLPDDTLQSCGGRWRAWLARAVSIGRGAPAGRVPATGAVESVQNYLSGASMLVGRRFVEAAGVMREDYFLYCEEVEWCLRARMRGLRLGFEAEARVLHSQGTSTGNSEDLKRRSKLSVYLNERNRLLLTRDLFPLKLPVAAIMALALLILRYARRGAWRQFGYALQGWGAGLRDERGPAEFA